MLPKKQIYWQDIYVILFKHTEIYSEAPLLWNNYVKELKVERNYYFFPSFQVMYLYIHLFDQISVLNGKYCNISWNVC